MLATMTCKYSDCQDVIISRRTGPCICNAAHGTGLGIGSQSEITMAEPEHPNERRSITKGMEIIVACVQARQQMGLSQNPMLFHDCCPCKSLAEFYCDYLARFKHTILYGLWNHVRCLHIAYAAVV